MVGNFRDPQIAASLDRRIQSRRYTGNRIPMGKEYVEQRDNGYYVSSTRVSLDSVVYAFLRGESPEGIAESFPAISLKEIFGALAFLHR